MHNYRLNKKHSAKGCPASLYLLPLPSRSATGTLHYSFSKMDRGIIMNAINNERKEATYPRVIQSPSDHVLEVESLSVMSSEADEEYSLFECMQRNTSSLFFLKICGNFWCSTSQLASSSGTQKLWFSVHRINFIVARLGLLGMSMFTFAAIIVDSITGPVDSIAIAVAVTLDLLSVIPAQYLNQLRMLQPAQKLDSVVLDESVRVAQYFLFFCLLLLLTSVLIYTANIGGLQGNVINSILLGLGEFLISLNLSFNLFFLIVDLKVSSLLLDQLFLLREKGLLTLDKFNVVRNDIRRRVQKSKWASDFIVVPSIASIIAILLLVFAANPSRRILTIAWIIALSKELVFVCIAFWYVARVNGRADSLTNSLGVDVTLPLPRNDGDKFKLDDEKYNFLLKEVHRLSIYTSSLSDPVSFTLLFKRLSWENVIASALGFIVTVVVGLAKGLITS
jgi:hypothetical protein